MKTIGMIALVLAIAFSIGGCKNDKNGIAEQESTIPSINEGCDSTKTDSTKITTCQENEVVYDKYIFPKAPKRWFMGRHKTLTHYDSICIVEGGIPRIREIKIELAKENDSVAKKINQQLLNLYFRENVRDLNLAFACLGDNSFTATLHAWEIPAPRGMRSFRCEYYTYEGGCHGYTETRFFHFDTKTGKQLSFEDILQTTSDRLMSTILSHYNDTIYELQCAERTHQFYFSKDGIVFVYDPYAIACYAAGTIEIVVPYQTECIIRSPLNTQKHFMQ